MVGCEAESGYVCRGGGAREGGVRWEGEEFGRGVDYGG